MSNRFKVLVLPGDGIGPEVMQQAYRVLEWLGRNRALDFDTTEDLVGGAALDKHGVPIRDETMETASRVDAILFGALGGPKWDALPFDKRPERALLRLRKDFDLFANIRPAFVFDALIGTSALRPELVRGADMVIVRELAGGIYFGTPRGIETLPNGERRGVNTTVYTTGEIHRIAAVAFEMARKRRKLVHSVEKSNVMESGRLWREEVIAAHKSGGYGDVKLEHMLADNCGMQIVMNPKQFDVILGDNLFGDLLSDVAAAIAGSLGMLPSASLGPADRNGKRRAFYEPVHGSAPDIAGKGVANPLAMLMSVSMMLRYSFDRDADADLLDKAIAAALDSGVRTGDIMEPGRKRVSTSGMGDAVLGELDRLAR